MYKTRKQKIKHDKKHEKTRVIKRTLLLLFVFFIFYFLGGYLTMPLYNYINGFDSFKNFLLKLGVF